MARLLIVLLIAGLATLFAMNRTDPERMEEVYAAHFTTPLPAGTELLQHVEMSSGFEPCHGFLFQATDKSLFEQIANEWKCTHAHEKKTVIGEQPPWWWLDEEQQAAVAKEDKVGRVDFANKRFWSVWYNPAEKQVLAEYGKL